MYKAELIENKKEWESFILSKNNSPSNILQSWDWAEFQKDFGRKIWRIGIYKYQPETDEKKLVGVAFAQLIPTKLRTHIYVSNGPIINWEQQEDILPPLIGYLKALGMQEKVKFIRIDPLIKNSKRNRKLLASHKLIMSGTHTQAEYKWILDISKDEETLLREMKKNSRYEIKRAKRDGVTVESSSDIKDFNKFEKLFLEISKVNKFIPQPISYLKKQFEILSKEDIYRVYWAKKDNKIIAVSLISIYGDTATYLHAASDKSKQARSLYGPRALLWQAIIDAKDKGCTTFDFYGIAKDDNPKNVWAGFTRFKKSFGGELFPVIRAHDIPISPSYWIVKLLESTREIWGGIYYKIIKK